MVWTNARSHLMIDSASLAKKRQFKCAGIYPAANILCLFIFIIMLQRTAIFLAELYLVHLVDPMQPMIYTVCSFHWTDVTGIASALYWMYFKWLRQRKSWLCSTKPVKLVILLNHQGMWFCSSLFGIAHHLARSSSVLLSGCRFLNIHLIGAFVFGISLSQLCFPIFAFFAWDCDTSFWACVCNVWMAASWIFDCWYAC